ncbi:hypothetical protein [Leifsonia sp. WHRI 6310E]|uniref:hypothetical protein n=1 Tax=Leifsonia sp. WHRI 6310E TaxID=3162562 RepID=UPI0032ECD8F5
MSSKTPTSKVVAGGVAGAAVTVIVWVASLVGVEVPVEVATSAVVLVSFAVAYLVPDPSTGRHSANE